MGVLPKNKVGTKTSYGRDPMDHLTTILTSSTVLLTLHELSVCGRDVYLKTEGSCENRGPMR